MKKQIRLLFAGLVFFCSYASTDDIEILIGDTNPQGSPYIHVVLDASSTAFDTLCSYGASGSCMPPFMTEAAYQQLRPGHSEGAAVSQLEVFSAVLSTLFENPEFGLLNVSLLVSGGENEGRILSVYRQLGADYPGGSGAQLLIEGLNSISLSASAGASNSFQAKGAFYAWYHYLNKEATGTPVFPSPQACSKFFSVIMATESAAEDGVLDLGFMAELGMPVSGRSLSQSKPSLLQHDLSRAFRQAMSISRTNVAPPVSIAAYGISTRPGEVYIPLYGPRATLRWPGNVKKFKRNTGSGGESGHILDARSAQAIVTGGDEKGQIESQALSFWTDTVSGVDGNAVERGGAGQKIPGVAGGSSVIGEYNDDYGARQLYVEPALITNGDTNTLLPFNADGTDTDSTAVQLQPQLGASTVAEALALIRWGRGQDVDDEDGDGNTAEARAWVMGSVIHSRPAALNYGAVAAYTTENPNIRIFVGSAGGAFHGIENTTTAGAESGREVFGFYPDEALKTIALYRDDTISSLQMRYSVDGSPSILTVDNNSDGNLNHTLPDGDEAYVYFGLRRGGYSYYALDVSNPAATPTLKWKISPSQGEAFSELGLGFSKPVIGKVQYEGEPLDVLIIAGGYHGGWDAQYRNRIGKDLNANDDVNADGSGSVGNAIYIINARTGELVWKATHGATTNTAATSHNTQFRHAGLVDSIPSSVSVMRNSMGIIHRLYVGDTGGAVWRVDLPVGNDPANASHRKERWFISKLAELGEDGKATDRRFFHAPDLFRSKENDGTAFDGVLISSGNRAKPNGVDVINYHFYIKDGLVTSGDDAVRVRVPVTAGSASETSGLSDRTDCLMGSAEDSSASCSLSMDKGWMIAMNRPGEKSLSSPLVTGGRVFFTSYVPAAPQACAVLPGEGYVYLVNLIDASAVSPGQRIHWLGDGVPSAVLVQGDGMLTPLGGVGDIEGGDCQGKLCKNFSSALQKTYWREPGVDEF